MVRMTPSRPNDVARHAFRVVATVKDDIDRPIATVGLDGRGGRGQACACLLTAASAFQWSGIGCIGLDSDLGALTADEAAGQV
jgi:hypothetical protein